MQANSVRKKGRGFTAESQAVTLPDIFMEIRPAAPTGASIEKKIFRNQLQCIADGDATISYPKQRTDGSKDIFYQTE